MPFPLRGFDTDNGSEFINDVVLVYCSDLGIEFTRSRMYRKNDQAWVEQKNGSVLRRLVGYRRLEGMAASVPPIGGRTGFHLMAALARLTRKKHWLEDRLVLVAEALAAKVRSCEIRKGVIGSDHGPVVLVVDD